MHHRVSYGLACLAAVLKQHGHDCVIFDGEFSLMNHLESYEPVIIDVERYRQNLECDSPLWLKTEQRLDDIIDKFHPEFIGITMPTAKYGIATKIARHIKSRNSNIMVIAGGPHGTILPDETIQSGCFDVVVRGEGEQTIVELIEAVRAGRPVQDVPGCTIMDRGQVVHALPRPLLQNLDDLPLPAWECIDQWREHRPNAFGTVFTSRGCPFECVFCASNKIWGRQVRYMSVDRIMKELQHVHGEFGTGDFSFADDTLILNKKRIEDLCHQIESSQLDITWHGEVRAELCDESLLRTMKKAGCTRVRVGIESGSQDILDQIKKNISLTDIHRAVRTMRKVGLEVMGYYMSGFPLETPGQVRETINLMKKLDVDIPCWSIVTPYPGTELYDMAQAQGTLTGGGDWSYCFHHSPQVHISKHISHDLLLQISREVQDYIVKHRRKLRRRQRITWAVSHPWAFMAKYVLILLGEKS